VRIGPLVVGWRPKRFVRIERKRKQESSRAGLVNLGKMAPITFDSLADPDRSGACDVGCGGSLGSERAFSIHPADPIGVKIRCAYSRV